MDAETRALMAKRAACPHPSWKATANRDLQECTECGTLRHMAFAGRDGRARTHTRVHTK